MQSKEGQAQQLDPAERMKALSARGIQEEGGPDGDWDGDVMVDLDLDPLVDPAVEPVGELPRMQGRDEGMVTGYEGGIGDAMRIVKETWITLERLGRDERWEPSVNPDWENELMKELPPPNQFQAGKLQAHWGVIQEYFRISGNDSKTAAVVLKTGERNLAFINGPFGKVDQILRVVVTQQVDCIMSLCGGFAEAGKPGTAPVNNLDRDVGRI
eukprot:gene31768-6966_t